MSKDVKVFIDDEIDWKTELNACYHFLEANNLPLTEANKNLFFEKCKSEKGFYDKWIKIATTLQYEYYLKLGDDNKFFKQFL